MKPFLLLFGLLLSVHQLSFTQERRSFKIHTVAFYNLENLFHPSDDPLTYDNDRTPDGKDHWTEAIYELKLFNMAHVISDIGKDLSGSSPVLIGVCEIENKQVLEDLLKQDALSQNDYGIVHFDSPDRRGIDVGLLYKKRMFTPSHIRNYELKIYDKNIPDKRVFTRDQLLVSGFLDGEKIHLIVSHWPSRSGGETYSEYKRINAAHLNRRIIDSLFGEDPYAKIISMGDLNDDPTNTSVKDILNAQANKSNLQLKQLYNPMEVLFKKGLGSLAWRDSWNLFDQLIISSEWAKTEYTSYRFYKAGIFNPNYLITPNGKYKGYPFRSFSNGGFTGGYSDHFPVYLYLIKQMAVPD